MRPFSTLPQLGNAIVIATRTQDVTISPGDQVNTFTTNFLQDIFSDLWETVLNIPEERSITKGHLLTTLPILGMEWRVSHEFRPTDFSNNGWTNSIHLTTGGDNHQYGYRTPAVTFHPSKGMQVTAAVNGVYNYHRDFMSKRPVLDAWTTISISQEMSGEKYIYKIIIGEEQVYSVENHQPQEFRDVKVYASDPWHTKVPGQIRAFTIQTKTHKEGEFSSYSDFFYYN